MLETSFGQTFCRIGGNGPSLVLLPGDGETSLAWTFCVESLAQNFRVYALDGTINDKIGPEAFPTSNQRSASHGILSNGGTN